MLKGIKRRDHGIKQVGRTIISSCGLRGLGGRVLWAAVWVEPAFHLPVQLSQLSPILFAPDSILFLLSYPILLPLHQILSVFGDKWQVFPDYLSHSSHKQ